MKQGGSDRIKRIEWVSSVVDVALYSNFARSFVLLFCHKAHLCQNHLALDSGVLGDLLQGRAARPQHDVRASLLVLVGDLPDNCVLKFELVKF